MQEMMVAGGSKGLYPWSGPGSKKLLSGTRDLGFFGEVTRAELFGDAELLVSCKLPANKAINASVQAWLKFIYRGRIIYLSKYAVANPVSWVELYAAGVVYGVRGPGDAPVPTAGPVDQFKLLTKYERIAGVPKLWPLKVQGIPGVDEGGVINDNSWESSNSEWDVLLGTYFSQWSGSFTWPSNNQYSVGRERNPNGNYQGSRGFGALAGKQQRAVANSDNGSVWRPKIELITDPNIALEIRIPSFVPTGGMGLPVATFTTEIAELAYGIRDVVANNTAMLMLDVQVTGSEPRVYLEPSLLPPSILMTLSTVVELQPIRNVTTRNSAMQMMSSAAEMGRTEVYYDVPGGSVTGFATLTSVDIGMKAITRAAGTYRPFEGTLRFDTVNAEPVVVWSSEASNILPAPTFTIVADE